MTLSTTILMKLFHLSAQPKRKIDYEEDNGHSDYDDTLDSFDEFNNHWDNWCVEY